MGIPSYFSYITRKYPKIISEFRATTSPVNRLYLDCNSIVYDAMRKPPAMNSTTANIAEFENELISRVINQIRKYIAKIAPSNGVFIAFDGVAPLAKMKQQRTRRYKAAAMASGVTAWSTANITPGTNFMNQLSMRVADAFSSRGTLIVNVSGSTEAGEGEQKMFAHMRAHANLSEIIAVYGLDADLIMLGLFHTRICKRIIICREAPSFNQPAKHTKKTSASEELLLLDINVLSISIKDHMKCGGNASNHVVMDYVFMCFFLGNDFMPHFPALNIRTHGMDAILDVYRQTFSRSQFRSSLLTPDLRIHWPSLHQWLQNLAKYEYGWLLNEYTAREKAAARLNTMPPPSPPPTTPLSIEEKMLHIPLIYREKEKYICPYEDGWEIRYYTALFPGYTSTPNAIIQSFFEGLEWVLAYYTAECLDWRWLYPYEYAPLLADLSKHAPRTKDPSFGWVPSNPVHPHTQLAYVTPITLHRIIPNIHFQEILRTTYAALYISPKNPTYEWAFCRYMWEAHAHMPVISTDVIADMDTYNHHFADANNL